ncbi:MAG: SHOCT domain-containing protein [Novosphingobium sp.]
MDRWGELERLGKLRTEGLLSDQEFELQKQRILTDNQINLSAETSEEILPRVSIEKNRSKTAVIVVIVVLLMAAIGWMVLSMQGGSSEGGVSVEDFETYALRSNVKGASLVRIKELPTTTAYNGDPGNYCGDRKAASTDGGKIAERRGWRVVNEKKFHNLDAVLIVRGFDPGTSAHCFSKDPNIAFFDGARLIGVLFSKGKDGVGMNDIEVTGEWLRVWDDVSPIGQLNLQGNDLTFDRVSGYDEVCGGKYRVPAVFNEAYSKARGDLGGAGWTAQPSNEETFEGDRTEDYRRRFPETDSCSGTGYGYCNFTLKSKDGLAKLSITTVGEAEDPLVASYDVACPN